MFTLIIEDKHGSVADEYTFEEGEFIVGRSQSADIILPSDNVSRRHARLYTVDGRCYVEDLNSANGVFVNGRRIHEVYQIQGTVQLKVGDFYLHIEGGDAAGGAEQVYAELTGQNLSFHGQVFRLTRNVTLVGRGKDCSLTLIDPSISRIHAKLTVDRGGTILIEDLKSSNGTFVNNERVEVATLSNGDVVRFGNAEFTCEMATDLGASASMGDWGAPPSRGRSVWIVAAIVGIVLAVGAVVLLVWGDKMFGPQTPPKAAAVDKNKGDGGGSDKPGKPQKSKAEREAEEHDAKVAALVAKGTDMVKRKQWDKALKAWKAVKELDPLNTQAQKAINQIALWGKHKAALDEAQKLEQSKHYGKAVKRLRDVLDDASSVYYVDAEKMRKRLLEMKAPLLMQANAALDSRDCQQLKQSLALLREVQSLDPRDATVLEPIRKVEANLKKRHCR